MIRAVGRAPDNEPLILLGLSAENVRRLQDGQPIHVRLSEMGLDVQVAIFYGETEEQMVRDMKEAGMLYGKTGN